MSPPHEAPLDLSGTWRAHVGAGDLHQRFIGTTFDDRDWAEVSVPGHWRGEPGFEDSDGPVLYRTRVALDRPEPGRRRFLVFDGIFYDADVWFDADYLGAAEGYFSPHAFELPAASAGEHAVAVEVACPPQTDRTRKRLVTGVFSHGDNLDPAWNPGGIWRPVRIEETGLIRIAALRVTCPEATEARARLQLDVTVDSEHAGPATLEATLAGPVPAMTTLVDATMPATLAAGRNSLRWVLDVEDPPRWWPWRLGDQPLCDLDLRVRTGGATSDRRRVRTGLRDVRMRRWRFSVNSESIFPMGSNHGPTRMDLAAATPDELARDVELAREANLDLLRLHAHVTRPELYAAADALGVLVWQDLPLQWGYGRIRKQATRQAREMVDLLAHHPSIAIWCGHDEPVAVEDPTSASRRARDLARLATSMFLPTWNKDVLDRSVARAIRRADPSRPVDPHSGVPPRVGGLGTDLHLYFGWDLGRLDGLAPALRAVPRLGRFVSEFGAQAVPTTAAFMEPERWPDLDWNRLTTRHSLQLRGFDEHVPPVAHASFDAWRAATQRYQAALIQLQVEDLRRIKYAPAGGFCHFCFGDGHPAVSWSVLDHERVPKLGFHALRDACRDVLPMVDPRTGDLHVASERRADLAASVVTVAVDGESRRFEGDVTADAVTYVGTVDVRTAEEVVVTLEHPDVDSVVNRYGDPLLRLVRTR